MFESFENVFDTWPEPHIPDKHVLHEIYEVDIVVDTIQLVLGEESFTRSCHSKVKLEVVWVVEEVLTSQQLVEEAPSTPDV